MTTAKPWLPLELTHVQPYSLGPLMGWRNPEYALPAFGIARMDQPERDIIWCLVAPAGIQRKAAAAGIKGVMMVRIPGLLEALGKPELGADDISVKVKTVKATPVADETTEAS